MAAIHSGLVFLHLFVVLWEAAGQQDRFELNIAILPTWSTIIMPLLPAKLPFSVNRRDLQIVDRSTYARIDTCFRELEGGETHVFIGPYDEAIALATESLNIAYLATSHVPLKHLNSTFQILPKLDDFGRAMLDLVRKFKWEKVSIFIDDERGLKLVEHMLTDHELMVKSWRLDKKTTEKQVRDHLVNMRRIFMQKSIVMCSKRNIKVLIETARSLAMMSLPYEWFYYDPGDQLSDVFRHYSDVHYNFTVFSMMEYNTSTPDTRTSEEGMNISLAHDAASILQDVVLPHYPNNTVHFIRQSLTNRIKNGTFEGITGDIQFDEEGKRTNFTIHLTEVTGYSIEKIGIWRSTPAGLFDTRLHILPRNSTDNASAPFPLMGRVAKVVTILEKPFCMYKRDHKVRTGNDRFEGFAIDLIKEVATMLKFDYQIYLVHDGIFGAKQSDGSWNGMIGELLSGNATMSVAPISINSQREEAVDFTKPFMTRYISVLMKVPRSTTSYFEFLNPLHPIVWLCTLGAFVFVSIVLYILERIGNLNRKECPSITFKESFWFVFGSLLQGSTDASPSTLPGRILTSSWWFFALILISSYTANLAAFLTVKKINTPIKSVADLASQTKIKYGTVANSGIESFFKNTDIEHFSKMWAQMSEIEPGSMVADTEEGFRKVKEGNYAFFWDTTVNKYKTIEDCDFMEVGPLFDPKGFGIGVPPGATYREELSMTILKLSDRGTLHELKNRWWGQRDCPEFGKPSTDETSELQIENVAGVFFILVGGIAVAAFVCLAEYFAKQISNSVKKRALVRGSFVAVDILQALGRNMAKAEDQEL